MKNSENLLYNDEIINDIRHSYKVLKEISEYRSKRHNFKHFNKYSIYIYKNKTNNNLRNRKLQHLSEKI